MSHETSSLTQLASHLKFIFKLINQTFIIFFEFIFQSRKQLNNHKCLSVCSSVTKNPQQLEIIIHHPSSFILCLPSSFFIHPSFISRLLSFSACFHTVAVQRILIMNVVNFFSWIFINLFMRLKFWITGHLKCS